MEKKMTMREAVQLRPEIDYVIFAKQPYRVKGVIGCFIEIYDEEPHNLHVDMIKIENCKSIERKEAFKILSKN